MSSEIKELTYVFLNILFKKLNKKKKRQKKNRREKKSE